MCVESQALSWIRGLCKRTHPLNVLAASKIFMALVAYIDDSGTHAGAPNSLVAGYWGGVNEWEYFEWKWKQVLAEFAIEEFHAKDFWFRFPEGSSKAGTRIAPYVGWNDEKHHAFVDKLLRVIESSNVIPFAYGISMQAWEGRPEFWKRIFVGPGFGKGKAHDPLFLSFQVAVTKTALYCKPGKSMHFIYDLDDKNATRFLQWYRQFKLDIPSDDAGQFGDLNFSDSRQAVPLQAADLLAYEAQRYKAKSSANPDYKARDEFRRAVCKMKTMEDFWLFDEPRLRILEKVLDAAAKAEMAKKSSA